MDVFNAVGIHSRFQNNVSKACAALSSETALQQILLLYILKQITNCLMFMQNTESNIHINQHI